MGETVQLDCPFCDYFMRVPTTDAPPQITEKPRQMLHHVLWNHVTLGPRDAKNGPVGFCPCCGESVDVPAGFIDHYMQHGSLEGHLCVTKLQQL